MKEMKTFDEIRNILAEHKEELKRRYKVKEIGIFGPHVRGEQKEKSGVDILVEVEEVIGPLKFMDLERYLSELISGKVDLVMKTALKPRIGRHILEEVQYI